MRSLIPHRSTSAFTFLELIAVITALIILMLLALPVIQKVKQTSQRTQCLANLRAIGVGFNAYAAENRNWLPPAMRGSTAAWQGAIQPYVPDPKVFLCPAHTPIAPKTLSYGYNIKFGNVNADGSRKEAYKLSTRGLYELHHLLRFRERSRTTMVIDMAHAPGSPNYNGGKGHIFYYDGTTPRESFRHLDRLNVLWVDGHVTSVSWEETQSWNGGPEWSGTGNYDH